MKYRNLLLYLFIALPFNSCSPDEQGPNSLSITERSEGWVLLFDGKTAKGWHDYNKTGISSVWHAKDGALICDQEVKKTEPADLISDKTYSNFDLRFEWKISKGGNSGVFINVIEDTTYARVWMSGPEYQILDNSNVADHNFGDPKRQAGSLYGLVPIKNKATAKPYTEWNQSRILQQNGKISFWLNDIMSVEEDLTSEQWRQLVDSSSLGKYPGFGKTTSGKIGLQDWAKGVAFRNIKIKELK